MNAPIARTGFLSAAIRDFRELIATFPDSDLVPKAKEELTKLGVP